MSRYCDCPKDGRQPVTIQIDGHPSEADYTVSVQCDRCELTVLIEKSALVSSAEIPVLMERSDDADGPYYELTARAGVGGDDE